MFRFFKKENNSSNSSFGTNLLEKFNINYVASTLLAMTSYFSLTNAQNSNPDFQVTLNHTIPDSPNPPPMNFLDFLESPYFIILPASLLSCMIIAYLIKRNKINPSIVDEFTPLNEEDYVYQDSVHLGIMSNPQELDCGHKLDMCTLEQLIPNADGVCSCPLCRAAILNPKPDTDLKILIENRIIQLKALENEKSESSSIFNLFYRKIFSNNTDDNIEESFNQRMI